MKLGENPKMPYCTALALRAHCAKCAPRVTKYQMLANTHEKHGALGVESAHKKTLGNNRFPNATIKWCSDPEWEIRSPNHAMCEIQMCII